MLLGFPTARRRRMRRAPDRPCCRRDGCRKRHRSRDRRGLRRARARGSPSSTAPARPARPPSAALGAGRAAPLRRGRRARPGGGRRARCGGSPPTPERIDVLVNSRRCARDRRRLLDAGGGVGERDRDQPERHVLLLPGRGAADARDGRRRDRQPLLGRRAHGALPPAGLLGREARRRRADEEPRPRPRRGGHPRQRALPRRDPHAADRAVLRRRRVRARARRLGPAAPVRDDRRRRSGGALSRE